jgi:putative ABC transport system permease protein
LIVGIILGILASHFLGEFMVSMALSSMGAAKIEFVTNVWQTWILCPLALISVVGVTISACCSVTVDKDISIALRS